MTRESAAVFPSRPRLPRDATRRDEVSVRAGGLLVSSWGGVREDRGGGEQVRFGRIGDLWVGAVVVWTADFRGVCQNCQCPCAAAP